MRAVPASVASEFLCLATDPSQSKCRPSVQPLTLVRSRDRFGCVNEISTGHGTASAKNWLPTDPNHAVRSRATRRALTRILARLDRLGYPRCTARDYS